MAAQRSMVLLRNENHTLPLRKKVSSIAVIGPLANDGTDLDGGWGVDGETPAVTVEAGLRSKLPGATSLSRAAAKSVARFPAAFDDFLPGGKKHLRNRRGNLQRD